MLVWLALGCRLGCCYNTLGGMGLGAYFVNSVDVLDSWCVCYFGFG